MKRSEMLEEMLNEYFLHRNTGIVVMATFFEHLLERQEKLGMMPPWISLSTGENLTVEDYESLSMDYDLSTCWEQEDEA